MMRHTLSMVQAKAQQQLHDQAEKTARAAQRAEKLKRQLAAKGPSPKLPVGVQRGDLEMDVQVRSGSAPWFV